MYEIKEKQLLRSTIERIKALTMECKQLSDHSAQTYERLTKDLELREYPLSVIERMKRSQEQCTAQQKVHTIQVKVMEMTQRIQPIQDEACQLFT
jgi:hypothetical protein